MSERLVLYNLTAVTRRHLFEAARAMVDEGHYGPAVVVAQAAVEVGVETAISFGLSTSDVPDALQTWIEESTVTSWSPTNKRVQRLWRALTEDSITDADGWEEYQAGVNFRHGFVHRALGVPKDDAERFIDAAQLVLAHVADVMATVTLKKAAGKS